METWPLYRPGPHSEINNINTTRKYRPSLSYRPHYCTLVGHSPSTSRACLVLSGGGGGRKAYVTYMSCNGRERQATSHPLPFQRWGRVTYLLGLGITWIPGQGKGWEIRNMCQLAYELILLLLPSPTAGHKVNCQSYYYGQDLRIQAWLCTTIDTFFV